VLTVRERPCSPTPVAGCAGRCTWTDYCTQRAFRSWRQAYAASYDENLLAFDSISRVQHCQP